MYRFRRPFAYAVALAIALVACSDDPVGVPEPIAARVELNVASDTLAYGDQLQLEATVYDEQGAVIADATVDWSTTDALVASVDGDGRVSALHVGSATVVAAAGTAKAEAELVVEPKHVELSPIGTSAVPYGIARVAVPAAVLADDALPADTLFDGTVGGAPVGFALVGPDTVAFVVPMLEPAAYDATVQLGPNLVGEFAIAVEAAPAVDDPAAVVTAATAEVDSVLTVIEESRTASGAGDTLNLNVARALLDHFHVAYAAATPEERAQVAALIAANPGMLRIVEPAAADSAAASFTVASPLAADAESTPEEQLDAYAKAFVISVITAVAATDGISLTCKRVPTAWTGAACILATTVYVGSLVAIDHTAQKILEVAFQPVESLLVESAGASAGMAIQAGGARSVPLADDASDRLAFDDEVSRSLRVTASYRSLTGADRAGVPVLGDLFYRFDQYVDGWLTVAGIIDGIREAFGYGGPSLAGDPPRIPDEPATVVEQPVAAKYLTATVSGNPAVSCATGATGENLVVTCSTGTEEAQEFTIGLHYASDFGELDTSVPAVLRIVTLGLAIESGQDQLGVLGQPLGDSLVVRVTEGGVPVEGVQVDWRVATGSGSVAPAVSVTGDDGIARTQWTLGPVDDEQTVTAHVLGDDGDDVPGSPLTFTALEGTFADDQDIAVSSGGSHSGQIEATGALSFALTDQPDLGTVSLDAANGAYTYNAPAVDYVRSDGFSVQVTGAHDTAFVSVLVSIDHRCTLAFGVYTCYYGTDRLRRESSESSSGPGEYSASRYANSDLNPMVESAEFTMAADLDGLVQWERREYAYIAGEARVTAFGADIDHDIDSLLDIPTLYYETRSYHANGETHILERWECKVDPATGDLYQNPSVSESSTHLTVEYDSNGDRVTDSIESLTGLGQCMRAEAEAVGTLAPQDLYFFGQDSGGR